ncbi:MAG: hypothetical protein AUI14_23000 [Actinobacteria bacterium 13_2_20CM_2_71_6]|nr:MAG: hypothetical protein AUI14_23000 [Actinobacteria bacterium 13_2_20CM_2_71_6]
MGSRTRAGGPAGDGEQAHPAAGEQGGEAADQDQPRAGTGHPAGPGPWLGRIAAALSDGDGDGDADGEGEGEAVAWMLAATETTQSVVVAVAPPGQVNVTLYPWATVPTGIVAVPVSTPPAGARVTGFGNAAEATVAWATPSPQLPVTVTWLPGLAVAGLTVTLALGAAVAGPAGPVRTRPPSAPATTSAVAPRTPRM